MLDRSSRVEVLIALDARPGDAGEELDRHTEQLGRRLRELDVEDVRRPLDPEASPAGAVSPAAGTSPAGTSPAGTSPAETSPAGTIPAEPVTSMPGALIVELAQVLPALHDVVHTVRAWLSNYPDRAATLAIAGDQIEVTGAPVENERELVRNWTERHSPTER